MCEHVSPNCQKVQEATQLFIMQLKERPENVVANCNALLEGCGFKLEMVREPPYQKHESTFWDSPQEQIRQEEWMIPAGMQEGDINGSD